MATKTATKKKTAAKPAVKKTTVKASTRKGSNLPVGILYENNPDDHRATGKYVFFYVLFACTTILFAVLAVELFIFASDILNKYESIEACARAHGATCEVRIKDSETGEEIDTTTSDGEETTDTSAETIEE